MAALKRGPVLPGDEYAAKLVKMYKKAEAKIEEKLAKALIRSEGEHTFTVRTLEKQKKEVNKILKDLIKVIPEEIENLAMAAYGGGTEFARKELKRARTDIIFEGKGINTKAINVYARQIYSRMSDVVTQAGRTTSDIYAALELETALGGAVGGYDSLSSVQHAMQKIVDNKGIVSFIDKSGREWNMSTYVEMLTRTVTTEIYNKAKTQELVDHGEDLVVFSAHGSKCPLCAPWEGKVVSISGKTKGYPSMAEAREAGMLHPNCRHMFNLWIEKTPIQGSGVAVDKPKPGEENKKTPKAKKRTDDWEGLEYSQNYTKDEAIKRLRSEYNIDFIDSRKYPIDEELLGDCVGWLDSFKSHYPQFFKKDPNPIPVLENKAASKMGDALGYYSYYGNDRVICIALNGKYFSDPVYFQSKIDGSVARGWHVQNATLHQTFVHEFGHHVSHSMEQIKRSRSWEYYFISDCIKEFKKTLPASEQALSDKGIVAKYVSRYGSTSESETFAEAFSEYFGGKKPREFAKIFGKKLIKELGGIK